MGCKVLDTICHMFRAISSVPSHIPICLMIQQIILAHE